MRILGIETSCDETAITITADKRESYKSPKQQVDEMASE